MPAVQVEIRQGIFAAINAAKNTYTIQSFDVEETYYPQENLEDLAKGSPKIKIVSLGLAANRSRALRTTSKKPVETAVQVCLQEKVNPTDTDRIDKLVLLAEQLMATCEDDELVDGKDFQWNETVPMKDENDLIYSYEQLTIQGVFQAIFTAHYLHIKEE